MWYVMVGWMNGDEVRVPLGWEEQGTMGRTERREREKEMCLKRYTNGSVVPIISATDICKGQCNARHWRRLCRWDTPSKTVINRTTSIIIHTTHTNHNATQHGADDLRLNAADRIVRCFALHCIKHSLQTTTSSICHLHTCHHHTFRAYIFLFEKRK